AASQSNDDPLSGRGGCPAPRVGSLNFRFCCHFYFRRLWGNFLPHRVQQLPQRMYGCCCSLHRSTRGQPEESHNPGLRPGLQAPLRETPSLSFPGLTPPSASMAATATFLSAFISVRVLVTALHVNLRALASLPSFPPSIVDTLINNSISVEWFLTFSTCSQNVNFDGKNDLSRRLSIGPGRKPQKILWISLQNGEK
uniref:Uncharacterized protein n=1 Tax=Corvus moneduloides TaxID=1196302 RepID=A0A8U7NR56_CORMO